MNGVQFTEESAARISKATVYVERMQKNNPARSGRSPNNAQLGRWVKITDGENGRYSWQAIQSMPDGTTEPNPEWGEGSHTDEYGYAIEIRYQSEHVLTDSVVWLTPAMGDVDYYTFDYSPDMKMVKISETIEAESSGEAVLMKLESSGYTDGETIDVYNEFRSTIEVEGEYVYAQITYSEGRWIISAVECGDE